MLIGQICEIEFECMFCTSFGGYMIITVCGNAILMICEKNAYYRCWKRQGSEWCKVSILVNLFCAFGRLFGELIFKPLNPFCKAIKLIFWCCFMILKWGFGFGLNQLVAMWFMCVYFKLWKYNGSSLQV